MEKTARRHYRVAKNQIDHTASKGVYLPKEKVPVAVILAVVSLLVVLGEALFAGYIAGQHSK